jgi:hypothetical protein
MIVALLCVLGIIVSLGAHLGCKVVERLAEERYKELVGDKDSEAADDVWEGVRPMVGSWGCLLTVLEFVRGLGLLILLGALLYLFAGGAN